MSPIVSVRSLGKRFVLHNQGGIEIPVLANVDFDVEPGETLVLRGPSGAGKSTLLRVLAGNYRPSQGAVRMMHKGAMVDIVAATPRLVLDVRRRTLSHVSQFLRVIPRVPTLEVVKSPMLARGADDATATTRARAILARLNLPERLWSLAPATFSGGEQQRVNIARAFVDPTPIILLDEPTASLDVGNREVVVDLILEARQRGVAIIGIFHDEDVRDRVATRHLEIAPLKLAA